MIRFSDEDRDEAWMVDAFFGNKEFEREELRISELQPAPLVRRGMACVAPGSIFWSVSKQSCLVALT
jgi:hypothetical protein